MNSRDKEGVTLLSQLILNQLYCQKTSCSTILVEVLVSLDNYIGRNYKALHELGVILLGMNREREREAMSQTHDVCFNR